MKEQILFSVYRQVFFIPLMLNLQSIKTSLILYSGSTEHALSTTTIFFSPHFIAREIHLCIKIYNACFEHSDWLDIIEWPIRSL